MSNVVKVYPNGAAEDPDNVLEHAKGKYDEVLILGWDKEGALSVRANLGLSHEDMLWLMIKFQHALMNIDYEE